MKRIKYILLPFLLIPFFVFAQAEETLPKAGLTPSSPLYFLDELFEGLRELITFNPEAKIRLHIAYAGERIAEMEVMLKKKGVEAKGLAIAQANFEEHAAAAVEIVEEEKAKGNDVSKIAGEIVDNFHMQRRVAKEAFEAAKKIYETQKDELRDSMRTAIEVGDTVEADRIRVEIEVLEVAKDAAEDEKDATIEALEEEKEKLHDKLDDGDKFKDETDDAADRAEDAVRDANERARNR